uniref:Phlebovirus_G2 domain-containing protein n=1 Tax=Caenorhabditis tropicalis TaxID=1561998 RepID=A0A1I7UJG7_9PELO
MQNPSTEQPYLNRMRSLTTRFKIPRRKRERSQPENPETQQTLIDPRIRTFEVRTVGPPGNKTIQVHKTSSRTPSPTLSLALATTIIFTLFQIVTPDYCDKTVPITHNEISCDNKNNCLIEQTEDIFFTPQMKTVCLQLTSKNQVLAKIKLSVNHNFRRCEKGPILFTKNVTVNVESSKRCHGGGECVDRKCLDIGPNSKLKEFPEANKYPGITYCSTSCGGLWCWCLLPTEGCLFYRTYATPTSEDKFQIYSCDEWSNKLVFDMIVTVNNSRNSESFVLRQGDIKEFDYNDNKLKIKTTLIDISEESGLSVLGKKFIQSNEKISLAAISNELFPLECNEVGKCHYRETCSCQQLEDSAKCTFKVPDLYKLLEDKNHNLPIVTERYHLGITNDNVPAIKMKHSKFHIQLTVNKNYNLSTTESKIDCSISSHTSFSGCYNCLKGAVQNITCRAKEPSHAKLSCDNGEFIDILTCDTNGVVNEIHRKFNSSNPTGVCTVSCGAKNNSFKVDGKLVFVSHNTLVEYFDQILNGETSITDIKTWMLPDPFSFWILYPKEQLPSFHPYSSCCL